MMGWVAKRPDEIDQTVEEIEQSLFYKLDGRRVVPCEIDEYMTAFNRDRTIGSTVVGDSTVSTVFLVSNHTWSGPPMVFETMIFGGKNSDYQKRVSTYKEAEELHAKIVSLLRNEQEVI